MTAPRATTVATSGLGRRPRDHAEGDDLGRARAPVAVDPDLVDDARLTAWGLLTEAHAAVERELARAVADRHGLSLPWYEVLLRLGRTPGHRLRMTELAAQISFSDSGLSRLADRMERSGHIERVLCRTDRRGTEAVLTGEGAGALHETTRTVLAVVQQHYTAHLATEELQLLDSVLRRLRAGGEGLEPGWSGESQAG